MSSATSATPLALDRIRDWQWNDFEPVYSDLEARDLSESTVETFLFDWNALLACHQEFRVRAHLATMQDTADPAAADWYTRYTDEIFEKAEEREQRLKRKFLESSLAVAGWRRRLSRQAEVGWYRGRRLRRQLWPYPGCRSGPLLSRKMTCCECWLPRHRL